MERAILSAILAAVISLPIAAQRPVDPPAERPTPQRSSTGKPTQYAITVKGRINGKRLTLSDTEAERIPLAMLRARDRQIRDHNRHCDEIAGIVSVPPDRRPIVPSVDAKKLGPFSVGVGGRESIAVDQAPRVLTLKVESITHLNASCVETR